MLTKIETPRMADHSYIEKDSTADTDKQSGVSSSQGMA
jgi:hypothetical protein